MKTIILKQNKLWIPVWSKGEKQLLTFSINGTKIAEFMIPYKKDQTFHYYAPLLLDPHVGKEIQITGEFSADFFELISEEERNTKDEERPLVHFTANTGWINDPNGLVYDKGIYHLYFQYNPFDTEWENMSWGHAVSKDLLHWKQMDTVMYPDENGMMFSGCGLVNDRGLLGLDQSTLLFFYSAAGSSNLWSDGKDFTQRIAYSTDGGTSFVKTDRGFLPTIKRENRDPKIFWHEKSQAYIMVLWLEGNSFAILRSENLEAWESTQTLELTDAWECPDLFLLSEESGESKWVFWSADGFYFVGEFDGYQFLQEGTRKEAYTNKLPYAAQTYSGINDRIVTVPWLRTENKGKNYRGAMGLPRELSLIKENDSYVLKQSPIREWEEQKKIVLQWKKKDESLKQTDKVIYESAQATALEIKTIANCSSKVIWNLYGNEIVYCSETGELTLGEVKVTLKNNITEFTLILDGSIVEITNGNNTLFTVLELEKSMNHGVEIWGEDLDEIFLYEVR